MSIFNTNETDIDITVQLDQCKRKISELEKLNTELMHTLCRIENRINFDIEPKVKMTHDWVMNKIGESAN